MKTATTGGKASHFLTQRGDVARGLPDAVAAIMVSIKLIAKMLEHWGVLIPFS